MGRNNQGGGRGGGGRGGNRGGGGLGRTGNVKNMLRAQEGKLRDGVYGQNTDMYRSARSAESVDVYLNGTVNLLGDLRGLTTLKVEDTSILKAVVNPSALSNISMIDLKLNVQGPAEDEVYAMFPLLIKNIRRGNTVLRVDQPDRESDYVLARKGLEKFFDLRYEFISPEQRFSDQGMQVEHHMQKNYILAGPLRALLEGQRIEVLKTLKANGENVQVSWCNSVQAWCICSKNVALLAQRKADADNSCYSNPRWSFAREMAHVWFDKLEAIKKERGAQAVEELKNDMNGRTFVGEYVGSQEHQHLVKYSRVTIIFYAVVENNSMQDCLPCDHAWALFDKWGLDKVAIQTLGVFSDYKQMCDSLCRVFKDVAKSEIAEEEEGNVLYFIKRPAEGAEGPSEVLSLCKLKTLEYRLFRKMREKLRHFYVRAASEQTEYRERQVIKAFIREARNLSEEHELPRPLNYYISLFKVAFEFLDASQTNVDLLNNEYVTFSEKLLQYFAKKDTKGEFAKANKEFFFSPILDVQGQIQYGQGSITAYQLKSNLQDEERKREEIDFSEDSEEEKKEPVQAAATASSGPQQHRRVSQKPSDIDDEPVARQRPEAKSDRTILIIAPFGVAGSGKSTIWGALKKAIEALDPKEWTCASVSSDEIRGEQMQKLIQAGKTKDEAFKATQKSGPQAYSNAFRQLCNDAMSGSNKGKNHVIFLDKNHPANALRRVVEDCKKNFRANFNVKKLYMVPAAPPSNKVNRLTSSWPFSENLMSQIYAWGQARTDHQTLSNEDPHQMIDVQTMFLRMNKNLRFDDSLLRKNQLDGYLRVQMSVESFTLPETLIEKLNEVLETFAGVGEESNRSTNEALLKELKKHEASLMQFVDHSTQKDNWLQQLRDVAASSAPVQDPEEAEERKGPAPARQIRDTNASQQSVRTVVDRNQAAAATESTPAAGGKGKGKIATFLGINCECDPDYQRKLGQLFQSAFKQAGESQQMINDFKGMVRQQQAYAPWKLPNSHHVTTLFIGGNRTKLQKPQFEYHQEGKEVQVEVRAVIYVPEKLVAGICFPDCEIENEYPHLTLMVSQGWAPVMSNAVIQATCRQKAVFEQAYIAAEDGKRPAAGAGVHTATNVNIEKKGKNEVVFVLLREPVTFNGRLKSYQ